MRAGKLGKTLNSKELNALVHPYRFVDNHTNLLYLAMEYATLAAIVAPTIAFVHFRQSWGFAWAWNVPVMTLAVVLIGAVQHRIAGLGHEASHYTMIKNRFWNELTSDLFCMFPMFSTTAQYRLTHMAHHDYTNDWEKDTELLNFGKIRGWDKFPMGRYYFLYHHYIYLLWPPVLIRRIWQILVVNSIGSGYDPYAKDPTQAFRGSIGPVRITSLLGVLAVLASWVTAVLCKSLPQLAAAEISLWLACCGVMACIPADWFYRSRIKPIYSDKFISPIRMGFYFALMSGIHAARIATGTAWGGYFWMLWILPMLTSFPYFMELRDVYQHANADQGKLTNTRVFFCDPFSRWAIFVYGQDIHVTHHLYPAVPHYNLLPLHQLLVDKNDEYAQHVVECHGTLSNNIGKPTLLDCMETPTREPAAIEVEVEQAA